MVWHGTVWYGMVWHGMARGAARGTHRARGSQRLVPYHAIPCNTRPCHAIPYQYYHILILLHYYLIIYYHLVILLYVLYCIMYCAKLRPNKVFAGGRFKQMIQHLSQNDPNNMQKQIQNDVKLILYKTYNNITR